MGGFLPKHKILELADQVLRAQREHLISVGSGDGLTAPGPDDEAWTNWGYELHLGASYTHSKKHSDEQKEFITIEPGEFALLLTSEKVFVPATHVAFISLRFRYSLKGLVNVSGFHVDPGYRGKLLFSVYNAGPRPVTLQHGDQLFMLVFSELTDPAIPRAKPPIDRILPEHIDQIQGPAVSLVSLDDRVHKLETRNQLLFGLLLAIVTSLVVGLFTGILKFGR